MAFFSDNKVITTAQTIVKAITATHILRFAFSLLALLWLAYLAKNGWTPERGLLTPPPEGRWPDTSYFTKNNWIWAAWASIFLCIIGFLFAPLLATKLSKEQHISSPKLTGQLRWIFPAVAACAVLLSFWIGLPRMNHSLWGDENKNFRQSAIGYFYTSKNDGEFRFKERTLEDAAFRYKDPNNHQLYAVLGRFTHQAFGGMNKTDPQRPYMTEWKYRLPALISSLSCIVLLGWLFVRLNLPYAGMLAMPLLALHPWFVRYATEARGYALLFALSILGLLFLLSALRRGRRRDWIFFGLSLAFQALAFLGYAVGYLMAGAAACLFVLAAGKPHWKAQFSGISLSVFAALLLWIPAFFPCLPGLFDYLNTENGTHQHLDQEMSPLWFLNEGALFSAGTFWQEWDKNNPNSITLAETPFSPTLTIILWLALLLLGAIRLGSIPKTRWLLFPLFCTAPLTIALFVYKGMYAYPWYLVPALPFLLALVATGISWPLEKIPYQKTRQVITTISFPCIVLFFAWGTHKQRDVLRNHSLEPIRESTQFMRKQINQFLAPDADVITIGSHAANKGYDDRRIDITSAQQLQEQIQRAQTEQKRLYVDIGQIAYARVQVPEIMALIDDKQLFEQVAIFWSGQEVQNTRVVFQLRPSTRPTSSSEE